MGWIIYPQVPAEEPPDDEQVLADTQEDIEQMPHVLGEIVGAFLDSFAKAMEAVSGKLDEFNEAVRQHVENEEKEKK